MSSSTGKMTSPSADDPLALVPEQSRQRLKLFNSYTKSKELFVPRNPQQITWYNCGPTVYDISHMGHARCYISFDIIRRLLSSYFGYRIHFVQNITDIDDKIIKRARQNYLWSMYLHELQNKLNAKGEQQAAGKTLSNDPEFQQFFNEAIAYHESRIQKEQDEGKKAMLQKQLLIAREANCNCINDVEQHLRSVLVEWLDHERSSSVNDNRIFEDLPRHFEADYFSDMDQLNILRPDDTPRVSEYIPQIIAFIQQIIQNGFAYVSNGSVYFDTIAFNSDTKHKYGKLAPEAIGNMYALQEGEGDLSVSDEKLREKRNQNDFALWKKSKEGEPRWDSLWGSGRPGWHIECSAMACNLLGEFADIHSGGIDLRFPHHENEIAQAEAYYNTGANWINYFLHTGHLDIEGMKMSKSLKNFISIKQALQDHSARQIRLAFLMHSWEDRLDYSKKTMHEALAIEKAFKEFFYMLENYEASVKDKLSDASNIDQNKSSQLQADYGFRIAQIDAALCDNLNTKQALLEMRQLVKLVNIYVKETPAAQGDLPLLNKIAIHLTQFLKVFGLINEDVQIGFGSAQTNTIGLSPKHVLPPYVQAALTFQDSVQTIARSLNSADLLKVSEKFISESLSELGINIQTDSDGKPTIEIQDNEHNGLSKKQIITPIAKAIFDYREEVRKFARMLKAKDLFKLCDLMRDEELPCLGIRIDDNPAKDEHGMMVSIIIDEDQLAKDPEMIRRELQAKKAEEENKKAEEAARKAKQERLKREKEERSKIPPAELFKSQIDKYSRFDERGLPTHDSAGNLLLDAVSKELLRQYKAHEKEHAKYLKKTKKSKD